jgi:hypothetical protein
VPYTPTAWINDAPPFLEAANLNKIELGIESVMNLAEAHADRHLIGGEDEIPVATVTAAGLMSAADKDKLTGVAANAINQTQADARYERSTNKGAISGYASLDGARLIPVTELASGTANNASYLRGDRTWQLLTSINAGSVGGFTATDLEKTANKGVASGYASLDTNVRVPNSQLGSGTASANTFLRGDRTWAGPINVEKAPFFEGGALSVKTGVGRYPIMEAGTIVRARVVVDTAPTGASLTLSLKKNGTQFTTITMSAGTNAAVSGTLSTAVADGDYLTVDITQVGSTVAGSNLTVVIRIDH